jgi:hypothetical protein
MRLIIAGLLFFSVFVSCNNSDKIPDVSNIKITLTTQRFERELFALDSVGFAANLDKLIAKYPSFGENYIYRIMGADPKWSGDTVATYIHNFTNAYRSIFDSCQVVFKDFTPYENDIKKAFQFLQYYFPNAVPPKTIITYIGPMDGIGIASGENIICIGLHLHLGKNFSLYKSGMVQETYPEYVSSRFDPGYIPVDCIKLTLQEMFPENTEDKPLVQQMVEKGKRLYVLEKILPYTDGFKLIGYTQQQLKDAYANERMIWNLFIQNNLLQTIDNNITKNYIDEGPKTQELGEGSPGNIGSFTGWQIVKKYMEHFPKTTLPELMSANAEHIFQEAKYKP